MAVLKKVLAFLLGDKKGRKFLGYTIGIVLFIALLPVIAIYGLFGWMSGNDAAGIIGYDAVYEKLPTEIREQIDANSAQLDMIEIVFRENGLTDEDTESAGLLGDNIRKQLFALEKELKKTGAVTAVEQNIQNRKLLTLGLDCLRLCGAMEREQTAEQTEPLAMTM